MSKITILKLAIVTDDQKADLLTKPLAESAFFRLRHMLIGWYFAYGIDLAS
jgi:hypothetical protein